jgi:hypothetical protein
VSNRRAIEFAPTMASLLVSAAQIVLLERFEELTSEKRTFASAAEREPLIVEKGVPCTFINKLKDGCRL